MAFVVEKVAEQEIDKYGMREINQKYRAGDSGYHWVIDRERNIFLRRVTTGDRERPYLSYFTFSWKGTLIPIILEKHGEGVRGGKGSTTWSWANGRIPEQLMAQKDEILADLREALIAFKDAGIYSTIVDHTAYFTF